MIVIPNTHRYHYCGILWKRPGDSLSSEVIGPFADADDDLTPLYRR